jgi:hypothetical protein
VPGIKLDGLTPLVYSYYFTPLFSAWLERHRPGAFRVLKAAYCKEAEVTTHFDSHGILHRHRLRFKPGLYVPEGQRSDDYNDFDRCADTPVLCMVLDYHPDFVAEQDMQGVPSAALELGELVYVTLQRLERAGLQRLKVAVSKREPFHAELSIVGGETVTVEVDELRTFGP